MDNEKKTDKNTEPSDSKPPVPANNSNAIWYILGAGVLVLILMSLWQTGSEQKIAWSELEQFIRVSGSDKPNAQKYIEIETGSDDHKTKVRLSDLKKVSIGSTKVTAKVTRQVYEAQKKTSDGKLLPPKLGEKEKDVKLVVARNPNEKELAKLIARYPAVRYAYEESPSPWLSFLPMILLTGMFVVLFILMIRRMGGAGSPMAFGRSRGKLLSQDDIETSFDDVAGIDESVDELREVVEFLKTPERFRALGGRIPKGVLLVGPPGTGKTLLAKAIAGEAEVPFFSLSGSDFVEMFVGVGAARVRDMFQQAIQRSPSIIFIDELDAIGKTRGSGQMGGHDEREQTLNALLVEMDGFGTNSGVIVIAATNRPETLDPALLRPGRFDRHVLVDRPDKVGREKILNVHMKKIKVHESVSVKALAAITSGFVGADLANLVNEAALLAAREGKDAVTMIELNEAVERSSAGLEKKSRIIQPDEKLRVAYHEAGHALVGYSLPDTDPVHKVSIIPRGMAALGYTMQRPREDRYLLTQSELENRIQVLLAGTITEEIIFDDISTGAQNDLERATEIARGMVMEYGMSRLGRVNYRESGRSPFLAGGSEFPQAQLHSEQTAREIDEEVKHIIDQMLEKSREILERRKKALVAISEALIEKEVIDSDDLKRLIEENSPGPMIAAGTDVERKTQEKGGKATTATGTKSADSEKPAM